MNSMICFLSCNLHSCNSLLVSARMDRSFISIIKVNLNCMLLK
uniref:Uncharacterized protein n=1 Tax=Musa acuminata subsp. malaccensis TaxID=214687 RepID=A0A804IX35_MUSAM